MSLQSSIVLLVLVSCTSLLVCGQSEMQKVVARSLDDESGIAEPEGAAGSSTTIYSQKHLSPHRMMHFGKRLLVAQPPGIFTTSNQVLDLHRRQPAPTDQEDQERQELQSASAYPFTVYFPMARSSDSTAVQQPDPFNPARDRQVLQVVQNLLGLPANQRRQLLACDENLLNNQQQQVQFRRQTSALARPKLMRLVAATTVDGQQLQPADSSNNNNESLQTIYTAKKHSSSSNEAQQQQSEEGQQEQQDSSATSNGRSEADEIDRSSRSVGPPRNFLKQRLMPAQFSMLLGGTPSSNSQASSLLNFIKKAEPQRMTFMHFGRRR